ncbi:EAL domain-containing protein [Luminiphilus sp.]|nr:EAL domain-containing protein [Luminiphilus sp.]MDB2691531.1 EAL domain-containing protein [Luminiphilus sp.]MDB3900515.1 EAL domain-containing protein [Luminiphilus sp.]
MANSDDSPLVLICEDDSMQRLLVRQCLESEGMSVLEARDGYEALDLVSNNSPDFIFMDVDMPGISGIETCRRLRARDDAKDIPLLIVTGADDQGTIDMGFEAGATQYITKPLNWPLLGRLVRYMLRSAETLKELKSKEDHLRYLAYFDHLTDLPNRRSFTEQLRRNLVSSENMNGQVGLIMIDIDHFKRINDSIGHDRGDVVLKRIASRLQTCAAQIGPIATDFPGAKRELPMDAFALEIARPGGDEFSLIVRNPEDSEQLISIAEHIISCLSEPIQIPGHALVITPSIGIAMSPEHGRSPEEILTKADAAAYAAKAEGRQRARLYDTTIAADSALELSIEQGLRKSLQSTGLSLVYQPQVDLFTGAIIGAEALVRWQNEDGNDISPERFIPVAERSGVISDLGDWILNQVNQDAKQYAGQLPNKMTLALNLSPLQFNQSNFVERLTTTLKQLEIRYKIELELTESTIMHSGEESIGKLQQLKNLGFKLAIDDFGTGYSSLNYLRRFPIDTLKIDQAFVSDIGTKAGNGIVNAIVSMGQALGLDLVAEGVETSEQAMHLRERACYSIQGYLISPPVPIQELVKLCQKDFRSQLGLELDD